MTKRYEVDKNHSRIGFSAKHLAITTVRGQFNEFSGYVEGDPDAPAGATGEVTVDLASVNTNSEMRDNHLRSSDFFAAEQHPQMTWRLTGIEKTGEQAYRVSGELTLKGVTKPLTLDATLEGRMPDPFGGEERIGVTATGSINRKEWGVNWDGVMGSVPVASDTIKIEIEAALVAKAAVASAA
jgi:polyisoprenoid-binding protein YceI